MDLVASIRREIAKAIRDLRSSLVDQITAAVQILNQRVDRKTQRTTVDLSPLAAGVSTVDVTWPIGFPNQAYGVYVTPIHAAINLGQVFVALQAQSKTATGCTLLIRNTSGGAISCGLDVLGVVD